MRSLVRYGGCSSSPQTGKQNVDALWRYILASLIVNAVGICRCDLSRSNPLEACHTKRLIPKAEKAKKIKASSSPTATFCYALARHPEVSACALLSLLGSSLAVFVLQRIVVFLLIGIFSHQGKFLYRLGASRPILTVVSSTSPDAAARTASKTNIASRVYSSQKTKTMVTQPVQFA